MRSTTAKLAVAFAVASTAVLGAGCASWNHAQATNTASAEKRGPVQATTDATITAKIKAKFAADRTVTARNIDVDTVRGVVTLNGKVKSDAERDRAIAIARDTHGVVDVRSNLKMTG